MPQEPLFGKGKGGVALAPLADRVRPQALDEIVGQEKVVGKGTPLRILLESGKIPSMILWGPPGTGKTTLARVIARSVKYRFVALSATSASVGDLREIVNEAQQMLAAGGSRTVVFIDEIHRWNKAQQDAFLPFVEDGTVILIGATTENPSFAVNAALLSRTRVVILERLQDEAIAGILTHVLADKERGFGALGLTVEEDCVRALAQSADGDARRALGMLELAVETAVSQNPQAPTLTKENLSPIIARSHLLYDKGGEEHYNIISALHKSMRGNDPNAAMYWCGRMLESGEDPRYITRRLIRFAAEDVGLADPQALVIAVAGHHAVEAIGMPECDVVIAEVVVYLARAPKSIAVYEGLGRVREDIRNAPNEPVPHHIRNAPTKLMSSLGYGKGYVYTPKATAEEKEVVKQQSYLPPSLVKRTYV